jgi:hypothetical protein
MLITTQIWNLNYSRFPTNHNKKVIRKLLLQKCDADGPVVNYQAGIHEIAELIPIFCLLYFLTV